MNTRITLILAGALAMFIAVPAWAEDGKKTQAQERAGQQEDGKLRKAAKERRREDKDEQKREQKRTEADKGKGDGAKERRRERREERSEKQERRRAQQRIKKGS